MKNFIFRTVYVMCPGGTLWIYNSCRPISSFTRLTQICKNKQAQAYLSTFWMVSKKGFNIIRLSVCIPRKFSIVRMTPKWWQLYTGKINLGKNKLWIKNVQMCIKTFIVTPTKWKELSCSVGTQLKGYDFTDLPISNFFLRSFLFNFFKSVRLLNKSLETFAFMWTCYLIITAFLEKSVKFHNHPKRDRTSFDVRVIVLEFFYCMIMILTL